MATFTIGLAEAKKNFSKLTTEVNRTNKPVTVLKNNKPWVIIYPASAIDETEDNVAIDMLSKASKVNYALVDLEP